MGVRLSLYPRINQVVELVIESGEETRSYSSRVADTDEKQIVVEVPFKAGTSHLLALSVGKRLTVQYSDDKGQYSFDTIVLNKISDNVQLAVIHRPEPDDIRKIQRRNYLRVPVSVKAVIETETSKFETLTEDLSGGGASFYFDHSVVLKMDEMCQCTLSLSFRNGSDSSVTFTGKIVRVKKNSSPRSNWASIQIEHIPNADQQKIIRFCFEKQIDMRK
jgi:c-di-GMP-binding flagellar brake protein YcgR